MRTRTFVLFTLTLAVIGLAVAFASATWAQPIGIPMNVSATWAQPEDAPPAAVDLAPLGDDAGSAIGNLVRLVSGGSKWYVVAAAAMWFLVKLLRGRAGFRVPVVSDLLMRLSKRGLTAAVVAAGALAGGFAALGTCGVSVGCFAEGLLGGLGTALCAMGIAAGYDHGVKGKQ